MRTRARSGARPPAQAEHRRRLAGPRREQSTAADSPAPSLRAVGRRRPRPPTTAASSSRRACLFSRPGRRLLISPSACPFAFPPRAVSARLLFHTLLAHSSEPDALPTLHTIVGYVTNFFGCADCVGHFAVLSARLETDIRELSTHTHHGGRERAALWLWQVPRRRAGACGAAAARASIVRAG